MKEKIRLWYAEKYISSPLKITDAEIKLLIENNCKCNQCGASIFELNDIPNIDEDEKEVLCESCWTEEYQTTCPYCENYVMNDDISDDYFVINQDGATESGENVGFYKILSHPFYQNNFFGFDSMIEGAYEFVNPMGNNDCQSCGNICQECVDKHIESQQD